MEPLSESAKQFWTEFARSPLSIEIFKHLSKQRGSYDGVSCSSHPHLQSENNGGHKAWNKLTRLLLAGPKQEEEKPEEEYEQFI
jgi:hypothetical protein